VYITFCGLQRSVLKQLTKFIYDYHDTEKIFLFDRKFREVLEKLDNHSGVNFALGNSMATKQSAE
jgi:hypothetical protein